MLNFDFWDKEWPAITSAPHIVFWAVIIVILVILVILLILVLVRREVARLKTEKAALSERLSLAHDEHAKVSPLSCSSSYRPSVAITCWRT